MKALSRLNMNYTTVKRRLTGAFAVLMTTAIPSVVWAASPFQTGANALSADTLAFLTPIAGIAIMVVGALAWFGKIHWMWLVGLIFGIVMVFGNTQILSWLRGLFGV